MGLAAWTALLFLAAGAPRLGAAEPAGAAPGPARLRVDGLGWLRNREMRHTLLLLLGGEQGPTIDANAMEDAAMIVFSTLNEEGYLEPSIEIEAQLPDGREARYRLDPKLDQPLPRPLAASAVALHIRPGQRFTLADVDFEGLTVVRENDARSLFRSEGTLFSLGAERVYAPARLQRSADNLREQLRRDGYADAQVQADEVHIDHATGRVRVRVTVHEGPLWRVTAVRYTQDDGGTAPAGLETTRIGHPWSQLWRQDMETAIRRWYYERGHPDVKVTLTPQPGETAGGVRAVTVVAALAPGPAVTLGRVRFTGNVHTSESVLAPLVTAKPGAPLNPSDLENARFRISHLGVFSAVDLDYEPADGTTRDAVYDLTEGRRRDASLLFGFGSYELLRGGIEERDYNLFGHAQQGTVELVQSMKSTSGEYDYSVPELFGSSVDGTAKLFSLWRQERSFLRKEYGANVAAAWPLPHLGLEATTGYTFERLHNSDDSLAESPDDLAQANSASVEVGLTRDRRDNPITPKHGYKVYFKAAEASRWLGGQLDYQHLQLGASYHTAWGRSRWIHVSFTHEILMTLGASGDGELPVNVFFYPGGDNSIRGYPEGEAAPRAADGQFVGAKSTVLLNLELEQALTAKWSLVAFSDSLGMSASMAHYPFDERLYSLGLGVRYQTLIGPIRLEYGRNLNPRPLDPGGALLFSLGYPF